MQNSDSNPNSYSGIHQATFPMVQQFVALTKEELKSGKYKSDGTVLVDIVSLVPPAPGEIFQSPSKLAHGIVIEVLEFRPAKGLWDAPSWVGLKPQWFRCLCKYEMLSR